MEEHTKGEIDVQSLKKIVALLLKKTKKAKTELDQQAKEAEKKLIAAQELQVAAEKAVQASQAHVAKTNASATKLTDLVDDLGIILEQLSK